MRSVTVCRRGGVSGKITQEVAFEQVPTKMSWMVIWEKSIPGRGNSAKSLRQELM